MNVVKKICCLCNRTNESDTWSQVAVRGYKNVEHGLCPACFAETQEKVKRIYAPGYINFQATTKLAPLPKTA